MISLSRRTIYLATGGACDAIREIYGGYKWFWSKTLHFGSPRAAPPLIILILIVKIGLVQAWVGQNETFRFETACNRYISPGSRRRHVLSLSKLFSCSRRSHEHTWSPSRKVNLSQGGRHQVRLGRIQSHRSGHWEKPRTTNLRSLLRFSVCSDRDAVFHSTLTSLLVH